ncbi:Glycosyltransferase involved in cell wall bisynthesis [Natronincola peptidivorans]|uniref:Glycosyltransferase involved in cell wall bisynthesis n=1 Tax=Natronincola peptidivorans TaxID=426128 RepID=A0A1I0C7X8_9FIRM|nr:glycosyltransferase [Natronincola peptidivorans]SET15501.1 Glycosyltransferase involved in cell wall bisynthesis [Natronincola peptidivorans]
MITISLCMIVKNEENVIARCLDSIENFVDEIIIVDTGSTDTTKEIAKGYTDKIFDFKWINDFSVARNYSYSKATMDYILWLDADDVILEEDRRKFKELKQTLDPTVDIVMMKYNVGLDQYNKPTLSYYRERLSRRINNYRWHEPVHEYLELNGKIVNSDICITHKNEGTSSYDRNLSIYEQIISRGKKLSVRGLYYYARELYYHQRYDDAIEYFTKFLDTEMGWVEDNIYACYHLSVCYEYKNDRTNMLNALLRSFKYDNPRAEICCQFGQYYMEASNYESAIVWYTLATQLKKPTDNWGFILHDYWGFIPSIQLCVCYARVGNMQKAIEYNDKAAELKPNDPYVVHNRRYFEACLAI